MLINSKLYSKKGVKMEIIKKIVNSRDVKVQIKRNAYTGICILQFIHMITLVIDKSKYNNK